MTGISTPETLTIYTKPDDQIIRQQVIAQFELLKDHWPELYQFAYTPIAQFKQLTLIDLVTYDYMANYHILRPQLSDLLNPFKIKPQDIKVVILGQDPYPNDHAHGYAFSSLDTKIPASLKNIFKALKLDFGEDYQIQAHHANLTSWVEQGVFLYNTRLTTLINQPMAKTSDYWILFTDQVLKFLVQHTSHVVYLLWGRQAQKFANYLDVDHNLLIATSHPSPLSVRHGFLESNCFAKTNIYLEKVHKKPIKW